MELENKDANTDFQEGKILLINKEIGWTSFDAVNKIRYSIRKKFGYKKIKVGHAGTLDPLASGLLIVCTGKATKRMHEFVDFDKEYIAEIRLGATTPSFDLETEIDKEFPIDHITDAIIERTIDSFTGKTEQYPPMFSAKSVNGTRAYKIARQGKTIELKPQEINITEAELLCVDMPDFTARFSCSKGTYIRSLARDLGEAMQSGAYLKKLTRTRIGNFKIENAFSIKEFEEMLKNM